MRLEFLNFIAQWGEPIDPVAVPEDYYDEYGDQLPQLMLDMWREIGFAGYGDGLLWVCDPRRWQPIVDTWLDGLDLPEVYVGNQIPLFRTAYGEIYCFKPGLGQNITITPLTSTIGASRPDPVPNQKWVDMDIEEMLTRPPELFVVQADIVYDSDDTQEDLFPRIVERLGETSHDSIYSFSPSSQEGGDIRVETATIADATTELTRLRALETPDVFTV